LLDSSSAEQQTHLGPVLRHWLLTLLESGQPDAQMDYVAVVDPETLVDVEEIHDRALVAIALRIENVRLIDNRIVVRR
jgi:pantoate--beta-alanine ligase